MPVTRFLRLIPLSLTAFLSAPETSGQALADLDLSVKEADYAPAVTLKEHDNRVVEEYRVNGQLYMMKITPTVGAPYYLVDDDGSGDMAMNRGFSGIEQRVPQWTLLSW